MSPITITILIASVFLVIGTYLYLQKIEKIDHQPTQNVSQNQTSKKPKKKNSLEDLYPIQDIRQGIIVLSNTQYACVCRASATDFYLLGDEEQESIEDAAARAIMQLNFPLQVITLSESVDTRQAIEELESTPPLNSVIAELRQQRAYYLQAIMAEKQATARQSYIIIPITTSKGFNLALAEGQHRIALLSNVLNGAKIKLEPMNSAGVIDFLATIFKPGAVRPTELIAGGILAPYTTKEGI